MGNHTNMTLKVPDEYKNLAKELFSINLNMRDTDYPFAHTIPLWRTFIKRDIEDYICIISILFLIFIYIILNLYFLVEYHLRVLI